MQLVEFVGCRARCVNLDLWTCAPKSYPPPHTDDGLLADEVEGAWVKAKADGCYSACPSSVEREPQVLVVFDLLHLNGVDLRSEPIETRRELLQYAGHQCVVT